jgi:hypothetical protein
MNTPSPQPRKQTFANRTLWNVRPCPESGANAAIPTCLRWADCVARDETAARDVDGSTDHGQSLGSFIAAVCCAGQCQARRPRAQKRNRRSHIGHMAYAGDETLAFHRWLLIPPGRTSIATQAAQAGITIAPPCDTGLLLVGRLFRIAKPRLLTLPQAAEVAIAEVLGSTGDTCLECSADEGWPPFIFRGPNGRRRGNHLWSWPIGPRMLYLQ